MLHGNPAVDIFNGLKLAAGGELGIGVGEEEWGSGEREVLEGFVDRTEGLLDLVVSRFGEDPSPDSATVGQSPPSPNLMTPQWLGKGDPIGPADGVIFSGLGKLSRRTIKDVSSWVESIYIHGDDAYGVRENPNSTHRRKRRKIKPDPQAQSRVIPAIAPESGPTPTHPLRHPTVQPGIPPPIATAAEDTLNTVTAKIKSRESAGPDGQPPREVDQASETGAEKMMKYLTLGYGSVWGARSALPGRVSQVKGHSPQIPKDIVQSNKDQSLKPVFLEPEKEIDIFQSRRTTSARFLIGLSGDLENGDVGDEENSDEGVMDGEGSGGNQRTVLRTLNVEVLKRPNELGSEHSSASGQGPYRSKHHRSCDKYTN